MIRPPTCPICSKQMKSSKQEPLFPFCSQRCRDIDLYRWSKGDYFIERDLTAEEASLMEMLENGDIPPELLE